MSVRVRYKPRPPARRGYVGLTTASGPVVIGTAWCDFTDAEWGEVERAKAFPGIEPSLEVDYVPDDDDPVMELSIAFETEPGEAE